VASQSEAKAGRGARTGVGDCLGPWSFAVLNHPQLSSSDYLESESEGERFKGMEKEGAVGMRRRELAASSST
jgi:hypothetical protein